MQTKGEPGTPRKLGDLPQGRLELAIMRSIGGCQVATVKVGNDIYLVPAPSPRRQALPATDTAPRQR